MNYPTHPQWKRLLLIAWVIWEHIWFAIICIPISIRTALYYIFEKQISKDIRYGDAERNILDVYPPECKDIGDQKLPVVCFLHGGGWGSGDKTHYAYFGRNLMKQNVVTVIPNYTLYPKGQVEDMIWDINKVMDWIANNIEHYGGDPQRVVLVGHSAGAHLSSLYLVKRILFHQHGGERCELYRSKGHTFTSNVRINSFIGISGVYHCDQYFAHECKRAVEKLSPMRRSMGDLHNFTRHCPSTLLESYAKTIATTSSTHLQRNDEKTIEPRIYLFHGNRDFTVPKELALTFHGKLLESGLSSDYREYDLNHVEPVFSLMELNGKFTRHPHCHQLWNDVLQVINNA